MQKDIVPALARLAAPKPMVAFEDLWLLFKPGQDVYFMPKVKFFSHQYMVGVLMKTQRGKVHLDRANQSLAENPSQVKVSCHLSNRYMLMPDPLGIAESFRWHTGL